MAIEITSGFSGEYDLDQEEWQGGLWGKPTYRFTNGIDDPLTFDDGMLLLRPEDTFRTDKGSVPRIFQTLLPKWFDRARFEKSYMFHDNAYLTGGYWIAGNGSDFLFTEVTRKQADRYLHQMILAEGGSKGAARAIYFGVRMGGRFSWRRKIKRKTA